MKKSILILAIASLSVISCKNEDKKTENHGDMETMKMNMDKEDMSKTENHAHDNSDGHHGNDKTPSTERNIEANSQKNAATTPLLDAYFQIKNALVGDDKSGAAKGAENFLSAISKFDTSTLSADTLAAYKDIIEDATEQADHIVKSPIDHQREHFETLSTDMNDLITLLGTEKTIYVDYCPMVKANWLSEVKDIKNPYYGSKMLSCGKVTKQIN